MTALAPRAGWVRAIEILWRVLVALLALGILGFVTLRWNAWQGAPGWQSTDDAFLQSDLTPIAARVAGYVRAVPVEDFQTVKAGQIVAELVDDDYRARAAKAEAALAAAAAQIETLKAQRVFQAANLQAAKAVVEATAANLEQNGRDRARQHKLMETGSSTTAAAEQLDTAHAQLSAQLAQNRAQAEAAASQLTVLAAQQGHAEADQKARQADLDLARIDLGYTRIVAPADGVLGQRQILPGQYLAPGGQVNTLTPLPRLWVIANYKETQLTHMALGDKAVIAVDSFPDHTLHGHVLGFAPASGAQFALLPPDNATGNFTKVVQRIAVKIAIDDADGLTDRLRPGMSVTAEVDARTPDARTDARR
jgi:membrane fusion protein (multidrug efflux system)